MPENTRQFAALAQNAEIAATRAPENERPAYETMASVWRGLAEARGAVLAEQRMEQASPEGADPHDRGSVE